MSEPTSVTLSSDTLFHFTGSLDNLLSILSREFLPSFCKERLPIKDEELINGIPMVCFCDIPLSQTRAHMSVYGSYAIGLKKSWGIEQGISPILYANPASPITDGLYSLMKRGLGLHSALVRSGTIDEELWRDVYRLSCFIKPYEGKFTKNEKTYPNVRFYDEREWRWVPELSGDLRFGLDESQCDNPTMKAAATERLRDSCRLSFEPNDIRYIVVARENELLSVSRQIMRIKAHYSKADRTLLQTRLISAEQIRADF
jgi:hypothetical protein